MNPSSSILVTGATVYVGGRLIPALLQAGHRRSRALDTHFSPKPQRQDGRT